MAKHNFYLVGILVLLLFATLGFTTTTWTKRINFTLTTPINLTNASPIFDVNFQSGMNESFTDVRFVQWNGTAYQVLPLYFSSITPNSISTVRVKLPSVANGTTLAMYFGSNNTTNVSDPYNAYEFFDDFSTINTTRWMVKGPRGSSSVYTNGTNVFFNRTAPDAVPELEAITFSSYPVEETVSMISYLTTNFSNKRLVIKTNPWGEIGGPMTCHFGDYNLQRGASNISWGLTPKSSWGSGDYFAGFTTYNSNYCYEINDGSFKACDNDHGFLCHISDFINLTENILVNHTVTVNGDGGTGTYTSQPYGIYKLEKTINDVTFKNSTNNTSTNTEATQLYKIAISDKGENNFNVDYIYIEGLYDNQVSYTEGVTETGSFDLANLNNESTPNVTPNITSRYYTQDVNLFVNASGTNITYYFFLKKSSDPQYLMKYSGPNNSYLSHLDEDTYYWYVSVCAGIYCSNTTPTGFIVDVYDPNVTITTPTTTNTYMDVVGVIYSTFDTNLAPSGYCTIALYTLNPYLIYKQDFIACSGGYNFVAPDGRYRVTITATDSTGISNSTTVDFTMGTLTSGGGTGTGGGTGVDGEGSVSVVGGGGGGGGTTINYVNLPASITGLFPGLQEYINMIPGLLKWILNILKTELVSGISLYLVIIVLGFIFGVKSLLDNKYRKIDTYPTIALASSLFLVVIFYVLKFS